MERRLEGMLDNHQFLKERDPDGMLETLAGLPEQVATALRLGREAVLPTLTRPRQIVMAGLGGSAIGGDLVRVLLTREAGIPVSVVRDYLLPAYVGKDTLVFLTSYSGNTEETLSAYADAGQRGAGRVVLTTGGKLGELARQDGVPVITVPAGLPPRSAIGYLSLPVLVVLSRLGVISFKEETGRELVEVLHRRREQLQPATPERQNPAKQLARRCYGRIPIIYGVNQTTGVVATRWKGQFNENAKALAYRNVLPEMNHNEIVGWEAPPELLRSLMVIFLRDPADHPRVQARVEIAKRLLRERAAGVDEFQGEGSTLLSRLFSLIYLGDYTSVYLALLYGINPKPVRVIDYLKGELAKLH